jgi:hypothetical protein
MVGRRTAHGPSWRLLIVEWGSRDPCHSLSFHTSASSFLSVQAPQADIKHEPERWNAVSLLLTLLFLSCSFQELENGFGVLLPKVTMHHGSELRLA